MTVLLVDDQIQILSGLISNLDWDSLGVTSIRTASSAEKARDILRVDPADILLCDIEMPKENGLSLLRWVRNQGLSCVCIFLTSHAEFLYAKEAIALGCFDYVLQPARYEDIQMTIARAIARVNSSQADKKLMRYGKLLKNHSANQLQNLFGDWLAGKPLAVSVLQSIVQKLDHPLKEGSSCFVILGHLLRWHEEPWSTLDWSFALNNMIEEVYESAGYVTIPFSVDQTSLGWFLFEGRHSAPDTERYLTPLREVYDSITLHLPFELAFYVCGLMPLSELAKTPLPFLQKKEDNVLRSSGIFPLDNSSQEHSTSLGINSLQLRRWGDMLIERRGRCVRNEIFRFLDSVTGAGQLDLRLLRNFWLMFQHISLNAMWTLNTDSSVLLPMLDQGERVQDIDGMRKMITEVTDLFRGNEQASDEELGIVTAVRKHVENNLDQPLTVSQIASDMYINPDYLSRLFKKNYGISLKEFILKEKMQNAQFLLRHTDLPISAVAVKTGYDNFSYFSQVYRKMIGISPSDERKMPGPDEPEGPNGA